MADDLSTRLRKAIERAIHEGRFKPCERCGVRVLDAPVCGSCLDDLELD